MPQWFSPNVLPGGQAGHGWPPPVPPDRTCGAVLCERLNVDPPRAAQLLEAVGATITGIVSPGQIQDVQDQPPEEMRNIFAESLPVGS